MAFIMAVAFEHFSSSSHMRKTNKQLIENVA
jgi:hypothetical protein